jgi:Mn2+/Fe2+ NRAMP family transporter
MQLKLLLLLLLVSCALHSQGYVVQMQAAKLGVVTGKHLAEHCR